MKILVYGTGAVGGYLGAKLANAGNDVTLICRPTTAQAITELDLMIGKLADGVVRPFITTKPTVIQSLRQAFLEGDQYNLLILGMKSYSIDKALNQMSAFYANPPTVLTPQNGIGIEEQVAEQVGAERIVAASFTMPVSLETRNMVIEENDEGGLGLAPAQEGTEISQWVSLFEDAGILTQSVPNHTSMKWSKALLNMIGNASSAILNRHPSVIYNHDQLYELEVGMLKEALNVLRNKQIELVDLPGYTVRRLAFGVKRMPKMVLKPILSKAVTEGRGNKLPSFLLDLNAGKNQNEVLYHNGMVAKLGAELGVPTPINTALTTILLGIATGKIDRELFNGKPKALLNGVERYS